jgi:hypothetical protein
MKTASELRAENAALGLCWKDLGSGEKEKLPKPLSPKEMRFLFTESSTAHSSSENRKMPVPNRLVCGKQRHYEIV